VKGLSSALLLLAFGGCRYSLDPNVDPNDAGGGFTCASDADCGGGWHCSLACDIPGFSPVCLPNGECDPCPSLASDANNCGSCGHVCGAEQSCVDGICGA
jgi:hypothetical protein